jgi:hypothetical protein
MRACVASRTGVKRVPGVNRRGSGSRNLIDGIPTAGNTERPVVTLWPTFGARRWGFVILVTERDLIRRAGLGLANSGAEPLSRNNRQLTTPSEHSVSGLITPYPGLIGTSNEGSYAKRQHDSPASLP